MPNISQNFNGLKSEILDILSKAEFEFEHDHAVDTLRWVKKIDENANEHLQIAALAHDIERGVPPMVIRTMDEAHSNYKKRHAKRSSQLIADLMRKHGYSQDFIETTSLLVERHEVGGNKKMDILKDADSISFFSCNIDWYFNYKKGDLEVVKKQIAYKYERATPRAKKLIKSIKIRNKELQSICKDVFK